jgi:lysozyme
MSFLDIIKKLFLSSSKKPKPAVTEQAIIETPQFTSVEPKKNGSVLAINQKGIDLIKKFEGLVLKPYLCAAGVPTIGYGSTFYENGVKVKMTDSPITKERAEELLKNTLKKFEKEVAEILQPAISSGVKINSNEFSALVSFAFNVGTAALAKSTLIKKLNEGKSKEEVASLFMAWNKARNKNGELVPLEGLTRRRKAEMDLFLDKELV